MNIETRPGGSPVFLSSYDRVPRGAPVGFNMNSFQPGSKANVLDSMTNKAKGVNAGADLFVETFGSGGNTITVAPDVATAGFRLGVAWRPEYLERVIMTKNKGTKSEKFPIGADYGGGSMAQAFEFMRDHPDETSEMVQLVKTAFNILKTTPFDDRDADNIRQRILTGITDEIRRTARERDPVTTKYAREVHHALRSDIGVYVGGLIAQNGGFMDKISHALALDTVFTTDEIRVVPTDIAFDAHDKLLRHALSRQAAQTQAPQGTETIAKFVHEQEGRGDHGRANIVKLAAAVTAAPQYGLSQLSVTELDIHKRWSLGLAVDRLIHVTSYQGEFTNVPDEETRLTRQIGHFARMFAEHGAGVFRTRAHLLRGDLAIRYPELDEEQMRTLLLKANRDATPQEIHIKANELLLK